MAIYLKELYEVRKTRLLYFRNSATHAHGLCLVVQLSPIHFNGAAIPHTIHGQVGRCFFGGKKQPCFSTPKLTL